jgi:hypothetical protein
MPLLNIGGITSTNQTFNAGFAFLNDEREPNYTWVLTQFAEIVRPVVIVTDRELALMNSISVVFPDSKNLICVWHINKNVLAHCKKYFNEKIWIEFLADWNAVVYSTSVESLENSLQKLESKYSQNHVAVWNYLNSTWLPFKEYFVSCYINQFPHFGSSSTSRVEGNHHVIKSYVRLGKLDLLVVFRRLTLMLSNQKVELMAEIERQKLTRAHHLAHNVFQNLHYRVSRFALDKIFTQLKKLEGSSNNEPCSHQFTRTWGLPCEHLLKHLVERNEKLKLSDVLSGIWKRTTWWQHLKVQQLLQERGCYWNWNVKFIQIAGGRGVCLLVCKR